MLIRKVKDLKAYLERTNQSPEEFAPQVQLSHMTIRRLLREGDAKAIAPKYHANFDAVTEPAATPELVGQYMAGDAQDFSTLMKELEEKGRGVEDLKVVNKELDRKLRASQVGKGLRARLGMLSEAVFGGAVTPKVRLLAIGAILYFVDPLDIVPDVMPGIGFIDDFSVVSLVIGTMMGSKKR